MHRFVLTLLRRVFGVRSRPPAASSSALSRAAEARRTTDDAEQRRRAMQDAAERASSWMAPWERAQMDAPRRPLSVWERMYWQMFVVLGGVGFAYETYVLQNRPMTSSGSIPPASSVPNVSTSSGNSHGMHASENDATYQAQMDVRSANSASHSHKLLSDDEVERRQMPG